MTTPAAPTTTEEKPNERGHHHFRFHLPHLHLASVFGDDWFALKAEAFARFFGTPVFLIAQTVIVGVWIAINLMGWTKFDVYPFILLNLAFSLQAAYAAPLILLAQTRQADRDKAHLEADAKHREDLAVAAADRQLLAAKEMEKLAELQMMATRETEKIGELLRQNTELTEITKRLAERVEALTLEMHGKMVAKG